MDKEFRTRLKRILTWKVIREKMSIAKAVKDKIPSEEIEEYIEDIRNRHHKIDLPKIMNINIKQV